MLEHDSRRRKPALGSFHGAWGCFSPRHRRSYGLRSRILSTELYPYVRNVRWNRARPHKRDVGRGNEIWRWLMGRYIHECLTRAFGAVLLRSRLFSVLQNVLFWRQDKFTHGISRHSCVFEAFQDVVARKNPSTLKTSSHFYSLHLKIGFLQDRVIL